MTDDRTTVARTNPGDEQAWADWYQAVYPRVYYVLFRKSSGDKDLCDELVQSAIERFVRYEAIWKMQNDNQSVAYLIRTAMRLWADQRVEQSRMTPHSSEVQIEGEPGPDDNRELDLAMLRTYLSDTDEELVQLLIEGFSIREIAKKLGIGYSAAGTRIHRIKSNLRKIANEM